MLIVAGRNRGDRGVEILDHRTLEVLRLKTFTSPAPGRCAVIAEGATDAIVVAGARQQGIELLDGGLCAAGPKFQNAMHWRRKLVIPEQLLN